MSVPSKIKVVSSAYWLILHSVSDIQIPLIPSLFLTALSLPLKVMSCLVGVSTRILTLIVESPTTQLPVSPNVSPRFHKRLKQGQNIDLSNHFIFFLYGLSLIPVKLTVAKSGEI